MEPDAREPDSLLTLDIARRFQNLPRLLLHLQLQIEPRFFYCTGGSEGASLGQTVLGAHECRLSPSLFCLDSHHLTVY